MQQDKQHWKACAHQVQKIRSLWLFKLGSCSRAEEMWCELRRSILSCLHMYLLILSEAWTPAKQTEGNVPKSVNLPQEISQHSRFR